MIVYIGCIIDKYGDTVISILFQQHNLFRKETHRGTYPCCGNFKGELTGTFDLWPRLL